MDRKVFFALVAFAALLGYLGLVFLLLAPFLRALAWAVIIGLATFPLYRRLRERLNHRHLLAASIMTPLVVLLFVLPVVGLVFFMTREMLAAYQFFGQEVVGKGFDLGRLEELPAMRTLAERIEPFLEKFNINFRETLHLAIGKASRFLLDYTTAILKNTVTFVLRLILMVFTLFFIYRDGEMLHERLWSVIPLRDDDKARVVLTIKNVLSAVIYGVFLTCLIQGVLAGIGYWLFDVPSAALLGALTAIAGLVPFIGTGLIWIPATLYLFLHGDTSQGFFLLGWSVFLVGYVDNLLRPLFISGHGHISLLVVALGLLGGLATFGFVGIIIGPVILSLFRAFLDIYRDQMLQPEQPAED